MISDDITTWVNTLPYWQRLISDKIFHSVLIDEDGMNEIYNVFKIENKLMQGNNETLILEPTQFDDIQPDETVLWKGIEDVKGINALSDNQKINIGNQLTIIYGKNGSGKSGYVRIFNNAFVSRGDKSLLPNIYSSSSGKQSAKLLFEVNGSNKIVNFPKDIKVQNYCRRISVFDSMSALGDMTKENELSLTPIEFNFFDKLAKFTKEIKDKFDNEKALNQVKNDFSESFSEETSVKKTIESINGNTKLEDIKKAIKVSDDEDELLKKYTVRKKQLDALNINERIKKINNLVQDIHQIKDKIKVLSDKLCVERIQKIRKLIDKYNLQVQLSSEEGLKQFENDQINNLGTPEWKSFIEAAKSYYDSIEKGNEKLDYCILCKQDISKIDLIDKYWAYLKSESEVQLAQVNRDIISLINDFEKLKSNEIIIPKTRLYEYLELNHVNILSAITQFEGECKSQTKDIINVLRKKEFGNEVLSPTFGNKILDDIIQNLNDEKVKLNSDEISKESETIQKFFNEYNAKLIAEKLLPKIEDYILKTSWLIKAEKCRVSTQSITVKQNELFSKYVTEDYKEKFKSECQELKVNIEIDSVQRGTIGSTKNKLSIKGKNLDKILSEGEQRSVALANFLAETEISEENVCVIFDDPVSSLDYERRDRIAKRLVKLAKSKQVVVLTHDLSFMRSLEDLAKTDEVILDFQHIQRLPNKTIGVINSKIPWIGMKVQKRLSALRLDLQNMTGNYRKCDTPEKEERYVKDAKAWCENLRETWERAIEETLLCGAVERYKPSINTQSLKKATFTKELYPEIDAGMHECSDWVHDRSLNLGENVPEPDDLKRYLDRCETFVGSNKAH